MDDEHDDFQFYDPIQLTTILEIFSLDVKRYDQKTKFIHYVTTSKYETDISKALNEFNFELIRRIKNKNPYLEIGYSKI